MGRGVVGEREGGERGLAYKTKSKFFNKNIEKLSYQSLYLHLLYNCSPNR